MFLNYQTYPPHPDLSSIVKCYWTLEVPENHSADKQRIVPDGTIEMAFILGDDIKRFITEDEYIIQPRALVLGQTMKPFYIQPTGYVHTFAIRFYPYGFAHLVNNSIKELINKETPIHKLISEERASILESDIVKAINTKKSD